MGIQRCTSGEYNISSYKPDVVVVNSHVKISVVNIIELNSNARV